MTSSATRRSRAAQESVYECCSTQSWMGIDIKQNCGNRGRGVVATRYFSKGEILADYHAPQIGLVEANKMTNNVDDADRRSDYTFAVPSNGLYFDGSKETCSCHPGMRTIGRLLNYATISIAACNVKPEFFQIYKDRRVFKSIIFVATRDILPLEEIRFDYGDDECVSMFGDS